MSLADPTLQTGMGKRARDVPSFHLEGESALCELARSEARFAINLRYDVQAHSSPCTSFGSSGGVYPGSLIASRSRRPWAATRRRGIARLRSGL